MPLDYDHVMGLTDVREISYTRRDTMLYALGVGFGRDPLDEAELPFVYERVGLRAAPTMLAALAVGTGISRQGGVDMALMVHAEQRIRLVDTLPVEGKFTATSKVHSLIDKGAGKGALLTIETTLADLTGSAIAVALSSVYCRGDGGFGGPAEGGPAVNPTPATAPDLVVETATRPDQALLYRLSGDRNALHADPAFARKVGYAVPILHGLCTYGSVGRQLLHHCCDYDPARLKALDARFSSPVYPGETLVTEIWGDGSERAFRTSVKERGQVVLTNGRAEFA